MSLQEEAFAAVSDGHSDRAEQLLRQLPTIDLTMLESDAFELHALCQELLLELQARVIADE